MVDHELAYYHVICVYCCIALSMSGPASMPPPPSITTTTTTGDSDILSECSLRFK